MRSVELWPSARTETWIQAPARVFEDHGPFGAIRTRSNPTYRWGNCLVLANAPAAGELPALEALHARLFPGSGAPALYWPGDGVEPGLAAGLKARGYTVEIEVPLRAGLLGGAGPALPDGICIEPLRARAGWADWVRFRMALHRELPVGFTLHRVASAWESAEALDGDWWVLREGGVIIASMGLFWRDRLARYQDVTVAAGRRGQGLGRLLFQTVRARSEASGGFDAQIIVADHGSVALAWYQRMGFVPLTGENFAFRVA